MDEQNQTKRKKSTKYLLIGVLVLFLSILGASVAYYLARVSGNLSGRAAGTNLDIEVTKLSTNATGDLIPLDNDLETLNLAAAGYDDNGACVDINGYSVCQIYKVRVINNGSVPLIINGTVTLSGQNVPHLTCAKMDDEDTITSNASCALLAMDELLPANDHKDYYVMVYIVNQDKPQTDSGAFNGTVTFESTQGDKVKGRFTKPFYLVEHIKELYDLNGGTTDNPTTKTEVVNNNITYLYATNVGLMRDRANSLASSDVNRGNYRYYGENPNNYIDIGDRNSKPWENYNILKGMFQTSEQCYETFDCTTNYASIGALAGQSFTSPEQCEAVMPALLQNFGLSSIDKICSEQPILWRIIDTDGSRIRIIRDESIGRYSYDTSSSELNNGSGINQWGPSGNYEGADLMKLLNPGYETNQDLNGSNETITVNNSLYWNSGSGTCYNSYSNGTTLCDFTNSGLSEEAKQYVIDQTLFLGGLDSTSVFANDAYVMERDNLVIQNPSDGITRTTRWTGKVGLPYPSDFGYAADFRDSNCQGALSTFGNCSANWMNKGTWLTISPSVDTQDINSASRVLYFDHDSLTNSFLTIGSAFSNGDVYPTLLLGQTVEIESGNGSKETPYVVAY